MLALPLVGSEQRTYNCDPTTYTYSQTKDYIMSAGHDIRHVRYVWSKVMQPATMEVNTSFTDVLQLMKKSVVVFCTAPRWSVDFLKSKFHKQRSLHCTFSSPGCTLDVMDTREDWWVRWCVQTLTSAVGGVIASGHSDVILLFSVDLDSKTIGSVIEWSLKEYVTDSIIEEARGSITQVHAAVVDINSVLQHFQQEKQQLVHIYNNQTRNELYFIRHAESESNVGDDALDPVLTPVGIEQAHDLKAWCDNICFDVIIVSPARRAIRTAMLAGLLDDVDRVQVVPDVAEHVTG